MSIDRTPAGIASIDEQLQAAASEGARASGSVTAAPLVKNAVASPSPSRPVVAGAPRSCSTRRAIAGAGSIQVTGHGARRSKRGRRSG